ncbi:MAG: hypothetical protein D6816_04715, partial [Bacteroidetes bacterium]
MITAFAVTFLPSASGQNPVLDSLQALLPQAKEDTNKVILLGDIAFYLYNTDPEQSLLYSDSALHLAQQLNYGKGQMNALYKRAIANYSLGRYSEAIEAAEAALAKAEEIGYETGKYFCYNILGIIYRATSDADKALEYGFLSSQFSKEHGDTISEAIALSNIGTIYLDFRDTANAKKYFLEAAETFRNAALTENLTEVLTNLSTVESDTTQKLKYIQESIRLAESINYENALAYGYHNLASFVWKDRWQPEQARGLYQKAIAFGEKTGDFYETTLLYTDL